MKYCIASIFLLLLIGLYAHADQIIYVEVADFDPDLSQFGVKVKGNEWVETQEEGAINGTAFGGPGDNNSGVDGGDPYLVIKLPVEVKRGESTADGETWAVWGRLYVPEAVVTADAFNSFFLRMSADAKNWTPKTRGDASLRWNDPGAMFPDSVNGVDVLFTDEGDDLPWFWQKHTANGQSTIDPVLVVGENYIEIGIRESDLVNYPRIDVICFRNDGGLPSDSEAREYLGDSKPIEPQEPEETRNITWGAAKDSPTVYIEPKTVDINTTFSVDVRISHARNLAGFQLGLTYDTTSLRFVRVQEGNALSGNGGKSFWRSPDIDTESGIIAGAVSTLTEAESVDVDDDILATFTFQAQAIGSTLISLQDVKLSNPRSGLIPLIVTNAVINIQPPWDVVPDLIIDIRDMVAVSQNLAGSQLGKLLSAQSESEIALDEEYNADVNRDGVVDMEDLLIVSNHFGEIYRDSDTGQESAQKLDRVLKLVNAAPFSSPEISMFRAHLTRLIAARQANSTREIFRLLPNYPNPFNPETWIPYQLAQDSSVTIRIYSITGQLVRTLDIGHKAAGTYTSKGQAAYWDGTNNSGEKLASGTYFCIINAGNFTASRKMILLE